MLSFQEEDFLQSNCSINAGIPRRRLLTKENNLKNMNILYVEIFSYGDIYTVWLKGRVSRYLCNLYA